MFPLGKSLDQSLVNILHDELYKFYVFIIFNLGKKKLKHDSENKEKL